MKKITFALTLFALLSLMLSACTAGLVQQPPADQQESTPTFVATNTLEPTLAPTEVVATPAPTEPPVVATEAPIVPIVPCEKIEVSLDNGKTWTDAGETIKTESTLDIGDRNVWTSRRTVIPNKAWNEALTPAELKLVETTWIDIRFNVCESFKAVIFAGGVNMNNGEYLFDEGALFDFGKGIHTMRIRNGEIILWMDENHMVKDIQGTDGLVEKEEGRLINEIRNGNFDIKSRLALAVSDALIKYLPDDIAKGVQIVIMP